MRANIALCFAAIWVLYVMTEGHDIVKRADDKIPAVKSIEECRKACDRHNFCCKVNETAEDTDYTCVAIKFVYAREKRGEICRPGSQKARQWQNAAKNQKYYQEPGQPTTTIAPEDKIEVTSFTSCAEVCAREQYCCFKDKAAFDAKIDPECKTESEGKPLYDNGKGLCWPGSAKLS